MLHSYTCKFLQKGVCWLIGNRIGRPVWRPNQKSIMAEFKFSCPHCGQHIQCDPGYAGMQINCPACQKAIIVPQAPGARPTYEAPPPPAPPPGSAPSLATRQSTSAPSAGRRFAGAPSLTGAPPPKPKSKALRNVLIITACVVVLAGLGAGGWFGFAKYQAAQQAKKSNPAAKVPKPTAMAATKALGILDKVRSAITNMTSFSADGTVTLFVDLSKITVADVRPDLPPNARNAARHPPGMPMTISNVTDLTIKGAKPALFRFTADARTIAGRRPSNYTIAFWSSDKGRFMFMDPHQRNARPTYLQFPNNQTGAALNGQPFDMEAAQHFMGGSELMTKLVKNLGQTADEPVDGQDCYTLTARVLGQKVKIWVSKASYVILRWQITLGGAVSDADIDDAFAAFSSFNTNTPPGQMDRAKEQIKHIAPVLAKIRGTITFTYHNVEMNQTYPAADFDYPVPPGIRLVRMPGAAAGASLAVSQRNACINNLRQIDGAKNEWALEKGKKKGDPVTEADLLPYLQGGVFPKCPAGGTYTIGKVGEKPTCSIPGHVLP